MKVDIGVPAEMKKKESGNQIANNYIHCGIERGKKKNFNSCTKGI